VFRRPVWTSPVALAWLRDAAQRGWIDLDPDSVEELWGHEATARIEEFRDVLARLLELQVLGQFAVPVSEAAADRFIASRQPRRLREIADRHTERVLAVRAEMAQQTTLLSGERFWHWVLYNIPPTAASLPETVKPDALPPGMLAGINDWGRTGCGGPCPPVGRHRYFHKLYALDTVLPKLKRPDKQALEAAMKGHVLAQATLVGTYEKHR
jgi:Raf kinase inhibitor-like YbhB/YbcL family protein